jgi:hypothetical protein
MCLVGEFSFLKKKKSTFAMKMDLFKFRTMIFSIFPGSLAIRLRLSFGGPMALRPHIAVGLPLSENCLIFFICISKK